LKVESVYAWIMLAMVLGYNYGLNLKMCKAVWKNNRKGKLIYREKR